MSRVVDGLLVGTGFVLVFGPWLALELLGGREAIVVLTGTQPDGILLAVAYFVAWVGMVFASVPLLAGAAAFVLAGRRR